MCPSYYIVLLYNEKSNIRKIITITFTAKQVYIELLKTQQGREGFYKIARMKITISLRK